MIMDIEKALSRTTIPLTRGRVAVVDTSDVPLLSLFRWRAYRDARGSYPRWYALTTLDGSAMQMHRLLTNAPRSTPVDHRDNDGLNNTRENLRLCTHSQNGCNRRQRSTLGLKGVTQVGRRFQAQIAYERKKLYLGTYDTVEEAHAVYATTAIKLHGEFACLDIQPPLEAVSALTGGM